MILIVLGLPGREPPAFVSLLKGGFERRKKTRESPHVKACTLRVLIPLFLTPSPLQITPLTFTPSLKNQCLSGLTAEGVPP